MKQSRAAKLLAIFMSFVMAFCMTPAAAFAETALDLQAPLVNLTPVGSAQLQAQAGPTTTVTSWSELQSALNKSSAGEVITLGNNIVAGSIFSKNYAMETGGAVMNSGELWEN